MPRAIAPEVTIATGVPSRRQLRNLPAQLGEHLLAQVALLVGDERRPELDNGHSHRLSRVEIEGDFSDRDFLSRLEALRLELFDHAHCSQPLLDVRE